MKVLLGVMMGVIAAVSVFVPLVYADNRLYVWTYEYKTMPAGMAELEYAVTASVPDTAESSINAWKHSVELEYGITDNWDIAFYQLVKYENLDTKSSTTYDGFKVETRYKIGRKGQFIVDPLLYFEYKQNPRAGDLDTVEMKLVLAKDLGDFNISYNQIVERNLGRGKTEPEYTVGLSYRLTPKFSAGIESKGSYSERESALGPALSWTGRKFWVSLGTVFGLNERTDAINARVIIGKLF